jgi:Uncharacterised nucleotidyltransferase
MSLPEPDYVLRLLRQPACIRDWTPRQFETLLRQATHSDLLHRVATVVADHGLLDAVPAGLAGQFDGAQTLLSSHGAEMTREVAFIEKALAEVDAPVVLLKGAAYLMAGLPAARGRVFSDVDILVPKTSLDAVEAALMLGGWAGTHQNAYDQRYYREWMHELPPMVHVRRKTAVDVHHAIAPLTARWRTPSAPLLASAVPLPGRHRLFVLAPVDMVLHSMVHLLLNDDLSHGQRDVSDLDLLLRHFGQEPGFWAQLPQRAEQLNLRRALHHGLWCVQALMLTPVPESTRRAVAAWGPAPLAARLLQAAWQRALRSPHATVTDAWTPLAMLLLYVRAHWLRMPPLMLAKHLTIKALHLHEPRAAA